MGGNRHVLAALLAVAVLAVLLAIIVLDPGGWGGFLREWAVTLIPQTAAAVLVWCLAVMALYLLRSRAGLRPPPWLLYLLFPLAALASLWALRMIYGRALDAYDTVWAAVMVALFYLWPAPMAFLRQELGPRRSLPSPGRELHPGMGLYRAGRTHPPAAIFDDKRLSPRARGSFRQLLGLVGGDRAVARRLVLRARGRDPDGSDADWVDAAIDELLQDRR